MASPTATDFVISQGDTQPLMPVVIPRNEADELIDLAGCTVTLHARKKGSKDAPPPITREIESFEVGAEEVVAFVHFESSDTQNIAMSNTEEFVEMDAELEVVDATGEVLTIYGFKFYIRDDIGGVHA